MNQGNQPAERTWEIGPDPDTGAPPVQPQLDQAMLEVSAILGRLGGIVQIGAQRQKIEDPNGKAAPVYIPHSYTFRWFSFAPAIRVEDQEQPAPEPAPEPVPVASNGHSEEPSAVPAPE